MVIGQGLTEVRKRLPEILEDGENELSGLVRELFADRYRQILELAGICLTSKASLKTMSPTLVLVSRSSALPIP